MSQIFGFDAYAPEEIAERVETIGVIKTRLPLSHAEKQRRQRAVNLRRAPTVAQARRCPGAGS